LRANGKFPTAADKGTVLEMAKKYIADGGEDVHGHGMDIE